MGTLLQTSTGVGGLVKQQPRGVKQMRKFRAENEPAEASRARPLVSWLLLGAEAARRRLGDRPVCVEWRMG